MSSAWLTLLSLSSVLGLAVLYSLVVPMLDDIPLLLTEGDFKAVFLFFDWLLLTSGFLWLLSCSLGAVCRRLILRVRGL